MIGTVQFGKVDVTIDFLYEDTRNYFIDIKPFKMDTPLVSVTANEIDNYKNHTHDASNAYVEYCLLLQKVSNLLPAYDHCLFHGAALLYKEKVFILTGPSGVGKTTQYRNLKKLYGNTIHVINGDKPVLHITDAKTWVYPSAWNGKENYHSNKKGACGGIIYLEQGLMNSIWCLKKEEAILPVLSQFIYEEHSRELIQNICRMEANLLMNVPVYSFINTGTLDSSELLYRHVMGGDNDV